jgi:cell division protein FtsN
MQAQKLAISQPSLDAKYVKRSQLKNYLPPGIIKLEAKRRAVDASSSIKQKQQQQQQQQPTSDTATTTTVTTTTSETVTPKADSSLLPPPAVPPLVPSTSKPITTTTITTEVHLLKNESNDSFMFMLPDETPVADSKQTSNVNNSHSKRNFNILLLILLE